MGIRPQIKDASREGAGQRVDGAAMLPTRRSGSWSARLVSDLLLLGGKPIATRGDGMPELHMSAAHWRDRAEEARTRAAEMRDADCRRMMLEIASNYDQLAGYAEKLELDPLPRTAQNSN
jgi:hypothetical protein